MVEPFPKCFAFIYFLLLIKKIIYKLSYSFLRVIRFFRVPEKIII